MMRDEQKTKEELLKELKALRVDLEQFEQAKHRKRDLGTKESEQIFRTIFENAADGILIADVKTKKFYMGNNIICQMLGIDREEINDLGVMDIVPEQDLPYVLEQFLKQASGELTLARDIPVKRKDGSVFYTDVYAFPITLDGKTYLMGIFRDVSERKRAEEAKTEYQTLIRGIMDNAGSIVVVRDLQGQYLMVNREVEKVLGMESEQIIGKTPYDIHSNDKANKILTDDKRIIEGRSLLEIEDQLDVQGKTRIFLGTKFPLLNAAGEVYAVCTVATDITEQRKMEKTLAESEEKYRTLVESAGDPISTIDERGVFLFANKVGAEALGYQPEDLVGKTLWDFFPKEMADQSAANIRKVIETGQKINTVSLREVQGQPRWYSATIKPLRDDHGSVTAAMVIVRDIDDMKRAEEQIKKLSSAVESSINGIAIGDAEGNLTYVNHALLEMWGYDHENEVLGRNVIELWEMRDEAENVLNTLRDRNGWIGELAARKKDGSGMNVQVCATLVTDENGKPISMMGSFVDISETKRKEEELSKYRGQMARAEQLASLGTLSATIAHQLTQPLTVIRLSMDNALDELEATSSSESVIRRLKDSVIQVSNITSIIERFRNFARKSSGKTVAEVNLKTVAVRIARLLNESARSANIALRVRDMGELPCPWMNETDLEQLFFAFIENSIQAADGKKTRQLVISGAVKDKHIELRLSDNCGGIAPENLDKIFEPFFTTKPRGQGTGLGLCIVQDVVSRIGGHVRVESEFGKGTTFIISLPVDQGKIA